MPEFVALTEDVENKTISLSVHDANIKEQKEMWGMSTAASSQLAFADLPR